MRVGRSGRARRAPPLPHVPAPTLQAEPFSFRRNGYRWTKSFPWDEEVTWSVYVGGDTTGDVREAVIRWMNRTGRITEGRRLVVEVGANIGTTSLPVARDHGCRVLAIEPVPENVELLERNIRANRLTDRIDCERVAVAGAQRDVEILFQGGAAAAPNWGRRRTAHPRVTSPPAHGDARDDSAPRGVASKAGARSQVRGLRLVRRAGGGRARDRHCTQLWAAGVPGCFMELWPPGLRHQGAEQPVLAAAEYGFDAFLDRRDLLNGRRSRPRPIDELPGLIDSLPPVRSAPIRRTSS